MEYERTEDGQIQADFAGRAGQVLLQYDQFKQKLPADQQFEATLAIALLQTMLTQCYELLKKYRHPDKAPRGLEELVVMANRGFDEPPPMLGITQSCILKRWPSERPVLYRDVIECIRNALSHPNPQNCKGWPQTGYTTQQSDSGFIEAYVFTQSPWVDRSGGIKPTFCAKRKDVKKQEDVASKIRDWSRNNAVDELQLLELNGVCVPARNGEPFVPIMRVRLDVVQLRLFTLALSDYLSEPIRHKVELAVQGVAA